MRVGAVAETITVTGESPIVDIQSVAQAAGARPRTSSTRFRPAAATSIRRVLIPGLQASQPGRGAMMDVGGTNNLQNTTIDDPRRPERATPRVHGRRHRDSEHRLGGPVQQLRSRHRQHAGNDDRLRRPVSAEQTTGGLRINLVPREGGNAVQGSLFATGGESSFQGNNYTEDLKARGLTAPNSLNLMYDVNPSGGGPIEEGQAVVLLVGALAGQQELRRRRLRQPERGRRGRLDLRARSEPVRASSSIDAEERQHAADVAGDAAEQVQLLLREPGPGLVRRSRQRRRPRR